MELPRGVRSSTCPLARSGNTKSVTVVKKEAEGLKGIRATAAYTLPDFNNAASDSYNDLTAPTSADLKDVGLRREGQRLIDDVPSIAPSAGGYVSSPSISSTRSYEFWHSRYQGCQSP